MRRPEKGTTVEQQESRSSGKELREWLGTAFGLIGIALALVSYSQGRKAEALSLEASESSRKAEVQRLLSEAWDQMGGRIGTTVITDFVDDPGRLELARRAIDEALIKAPEDAVAHRLKGVYLEAIGSPALAIASYRRAI